MKKLAMLSVLLVASACVASTATFSLEVDSVAKTYQVYATTEGDDNHGLDTFSFNVVLGGAVTPGQKLNPDYDPEDPESPQYVLDAQLDCPSQFNLLPINGVQVAPGVINFAASQSSIYAGSYSSSNDKLVLKNGGIGEKLLLASGGYDYTNGSGTLDLQIDFNGNLPLVLYLKKVYPANNPTTWRGPGNVEYVSSVTVNYMLDGEAVAGPIVIPEPTTIGLLCLGLIGLIRRK